jgi:hypothetical protein
MSEETPLDKNHEADAGWPSRAVKLREQSWQVGQELLELGRNLLGFIRQEPQSAAYLTQVHRLVELGTELSRHSATAALHESDSDCPKCCARWKEFEATLDKVYSQPLPGEVADSGSASPSTDQAIH